MGGRPGRADSTRPYGHHTNTYLKMHGRRYELSPERTWWNRVISRTLRSFLCLSGESCSAFSATEVLSI